MKFPCLIPKKFCNTYISLIIDQEGISEYGEPLEPIVFSGRCNYQDKARRILTEDKKIIEISGTALFPGDICPEMFAISGGEATIYENGVTIYPNENVFPDNDVYANKGKLIVKRRIYQGRKARNPDGTVNYTEVLLK